MQSQHEEMFTYMKKFMNNEKEGVVDETDYED